MISLLTALVISCQSYSYSYGEWNCHTMNVGEICAGMGRPDYQEIKCLGDQYCERSVSIQCDEWNKVNSPSEFDEAFFFGPGYSNERYVPFE